jgi:hypothetical protein
MFHEVVNDFHNSFERDLLETDNIPFLLLCVQCLINLIEIDWVYILG